MFKSLGSNEWQAKDSRGVDSITFLVFVAVLMVCMYPEITLAASLEGQLDKIGTLANGKIKLIGITGATILGSIWSIVKGNLKLMALIIGIGICISLYLEWIEGGMKITS